MAAGLWPQHACLDHLGKFAIQPSVVGCRLTIIRSGGRNCGRLCIQRYLLPYTESRLILLHSAA